MIGKMGILQRIFNHQDKAAQSAAQNDLEAAKTEFISVVTHQLRAPLGAMRWSLEMLLAGDMGKIPLDVEHTLQELYESNQRMIGLVNDLLSVSRIEQGRVADEPVETDVVAVVQSAIKEIEVLSKVKMLDLKLAVEGRIPAITIDPKRLYQVIENLLSNALKYGRFRGFVKITVEKVNDNIRMSVVDNGMGIPYADQDKIFSRFFRASNAVISDTEGSGLGLYLVKLYVESWGGKVDFVSEERKGSVFTIHLPLQPSNYTLSANLATKTDQP